MSKTRGVNIDKQGQCRLVQVSRREFRDFIKRHNLMPDGFWANGGYCQSRFLGGGLRERARVSSDSRETIYEIERDGS